MLGWRGQKMEECRSLSRHMEDGFPEESLGPMMDSSEKGISIRAFGVACQCSIA